MRAPLLGQRTLPRQVGLRWGAAWAARLGRGSGLPQSGALLQWATPRLGSALPAQSLSSGACPVAAGDLCHPRPPICHSFLLNLHPWAKISTVEDSSDNILLLNVKKARRRAKKKLQMKLVAYFGIENNLLKVYNLGQEIPPIIQGCTRLLTEGNHIFSHYTHQKLTL